MLNARGSRKHAGVSVLFSEPKIPQYYDPVIAARWAYVSFSALQRAENSSMRWIARSRR